MPAFIAAILGGLISIVGTLAGRVLIALGISVVTYTGFSATLDYLKSQSISYLSALPPNIVGVLGLLKVGVVISIIMSAVTAKMVLSGLTSDAVKKWVIK